MVDVLAPQRDSEVAPAEALIREAKLRARRRHLLVGGAAVAVVVAIVLGIAFDLFGDGRRSSAPSPPPGLAVAPRGTVTASVLILFTGATIASVPGVVRVIVRHGAQVVKREAVPTRRPFNLSLPPGTYTMSAHTAGWPYPKTVRIAGVRCLSGVDVSGLGTPMVNLKNGGIAPVSVKVAAGKSVKLAWTCVPDPMIG